ncbi:MAG: ABC transporter permease [gamma proteobacterium endosymbiont of Lamellibrachia anaximandri]|nr:ABC transporter permease [gamma proteobacterium endosymbiont of Lamellibrachia anaximandri]MBL3535199.1 ABC transporter permease [gamma proteobacterium endosymbiont of Lamellibrachia anaximandri]
MRLRGMIRKEWLQILRDPSSLAIAFILPLVLLLLFGYGVSLDARHIPLALVVEQPDAQTASLTGAFERSDYFTPTRFSNIQAAQLALKTHQVDGIVWLRNNFGCCLLAGDNAAIGVIVNGVNANQARITEGYIQGVWQTWLQNQSNAEGRDLPIPVTLEHRIWFNPAMRSQDFLIPGLIAVIMTLTGALLTAMVVAREWERGTMEALMVTPIRIWEILIGKLIPYFVLGMGGMLLTVAMARWQFDVPLRGSFWTLLGSSALFMLVALGMGLLISILAKSQFVAGQVAIIVTFLPAFLLSGFIFDISSMPTAVQAITHLVPARYFVAILQTLFLAGDIWPLVLANSSALLLISLIFLVLIKYKARKRLD